jgi:polyisoprenoid-binding protein YceI
MKRTLSLLTLLIVTAALPAAAADTYTVDGAHSNVKFKIRHLVSKTSGEFATFDGRIVADWENLDNSKVELTIDAVSIDTGNADRDKHLRSADFFDVEKYPKISFTSSKITRIEGRTYNVLGTLTMHGVAKEVNLPVTFLGEMQDPWGNTKAGFELETTINRKDFGITWNKAMDTGGVILGDEVEIEVNLEVAKAKAE